MLRMTYSIDDYKDRYANHIAEAGATTDEEVAKAIGKALYWSRVATPQDFEKFHETFKDYDHGLGGWKKWGGGNKKASGTTATRKAKIAAISKAVGDSADSVNVTQAPDANRNDYAQSSYDDGLGFKVNQFLAGINAKANDTQGKNLPSNPSWGFSQKTLNAAGARGADPSFAGEAGRNVYGGDMRSSVTPTSTNRMAMSFRGIPTGLRSLFADSYNIADSNRGLNRGKDYSVGHDGSYGYTTDSDFGRRMRDAVLAEMIRTRA